MCISALLLVTPTLFAQSTHDTLDLVGTPDLIVRGDMLGQQWVERDEDLPSTYCSVNEGQVTPGIRRIVRFTVMTPNIGDAAPFLGDPGAHFAANDGLYEYATCHHH
ncbi:MAG: hypothetical protein ABIP63_01830 [Thermoanaerobaculia bacterium]